MIYSAVDDNWLRVELLHSMVMTFHEITQGKELNIEVSAEGKVVLSNFGLYYDIEKESCSVGMLIVWSVVTLEALVNQALAETITDYNSAKESIENPDQYIKRSKIKSNGKSGLARKIEILNRNECEISQAIGLAEYICDLRNVIVHDKPFDYTDCGDGVIDIVDLRKRGKPIEKKLRYKDLQAFYQSCDHIREFILKYFDSDHLKIYGSSFVSLIKG